MKSPSWITAQGAAFEYFDGVPQLVVPDNPTTATHCQVKGGAARAVNTRYQQLADHYGTAIVPARVGKPRDKAAMESAVQVVNKRVIGYLAEEVWTTVEALNTAITGRVEEINEHICCVDGTARWERFATGGGPPAGPAAGRRLRDCGVETAQGRTELSPQLRFPVLLGALQLCRAAAARAGHLHDGNDLRR